MPYDHSTNSFFYVFVNALSNAYPTVNSEMGLSFLSLILLSLVRS
jgi:hypothetical protein